MQPQQHAEGEGLLGSLCPGQKKLEGKTFYLDSVKKRSNALLLEAIPLLGGRVESFLHKDVSFVVTGSQEGLKEQKHTDAKAGAKGTNEEAQRPIMQRESLLSSVKQRPGTPRPTPCGSRGKALLEKAIRNNERLQGSSVLANARSWGVKILGADDVLLYLKHLTRESFSAIHKKPERNCNKKQGYVVKAAALRSPFLKIEDLSNDAAPQEPRAHADTISIRWGFASSTACSCRGSLCANRRFKPLHLQSMTFPTLWFSGRFSPFETPPPLFEKPAEPRENKAREKKKVESSSKDKSQTPQSLNPSPLLPRKKEISYCECCHQPFTNMEEHLQTDQHRAFVVNPSNYSVVDQLVAGMLPGFDPNPPQSDETLNRPPTPLPVCELEPLTDAETEHAVQALQRQSSSYSNHINRPNLGPLSLVPASPAPGVQLPCQLPDRHPRASSPPMPVLDVEPANNSASQQPDTQHLSPCLDSSCPSPDPYSLPPVLSPQVPYASYIMEPHSPYSEPPVLSPQCYTAEEAEIGHICEMDTAESVSQSVPDPISTTRFPSVALTKAEGSNRDTFWGSSEIIRSTNGLEFATLVSRRSRSLPRPMATAQNPKKRCRSASPGQSRSKRMRITAEIGYRSSWNKQGCTSVKPERDIMAKPVSLLFDKDFCQTSKQTFTMFCVPTVPKTNQIDILDHGYTCVSDHPSRPPSSKAKTCDPPSQFPSDKIHCALFSQESQHSLSLSTSVCIEAALIPDLAVLSSPSSDSDWDCGLMSRLGPASAAPLSPTEQSCELDKELLHMPCTWLHDTSYESRLHTVLQPSAPSLCGEEMEPSGFSRTVVQIVEVHH